MSGESLRESIWLQVTNVYGMKSIASTSISIVAEAIRVYEEVSQFVMVP